MPALTFSPVEEIITEIANGRLVIVADDPGRENEADLIGSASLSTPETIAFMATHGRGLICAPLTAARVEALDLPPMSRRNREEYRTAFTVSVDASEGITTGISAADRSLTIRLLADQQASSDSLVQPGHVFPLQAVDDGVLRRAGHTEAAVDLVRMANLPAAGILCEIMHEDGTMARVGDLGCYQETHGLKACTIAQIIEYRRRTERLIEHEETIDLPTDYGPFDCHLYRSHTDNSHHLALTRGKIDSDTPILVRVHSECLTGDVFSSRRCDCGSQLHTALDHISKDGGVLLYLRQEGRGIGLSAKIQAYKLQEKGFDTVEANEKLGFPSDLRHYGMGAQILHDLGVRKIRLLTNNPKKVVGLEGYGLEIIDQVPIRSETNPHNERYLQTKRDKLGHHL